MLFFFCCLFLAHEECRDRKIRETHCDLSHNAKPDWVSFATVPPTRDLRCLPMVGTSQVFNVWDSSVLGRDCLALSLSEMNTKYLHAQ
jgi:hypothetical protein